MMIDLDYRVLKYLFNNKEPIKVSQMAHKLGIKHSTLGSCVKRLRTNGYVNYEPFYDVKLTNKGIEIAKELLRHEHLVELLFFNELGLTVEEAQAESAKLNLLLSCNTINKICEKYGHPKKCPCGEEINNSKNCFCEEISKLDITN